jgi:hypothetical protein
VAFIIVAPIVGHNQAKVAKLEPMIMKVLVHQFVLARKYNP